MASEVDNLLASVRDVCSFCQAREGQLHLDDRCVKRAIYWNSPLCGSRSPLPGLTVCAWVSQAVIKAQALWHRSERLFTTASFGHKSHTHPLPLVKSFSAIPLLHFPKLLAIPPPPPHSPLSHLGYCPPFSPFMLLTLLCNVVYLAWKGQRARLIERCWTHGFHMFSSSSLVLLF